MSAVHHLPGPTAQGPRLTLAALTTDWIAPPNQYYALHLDCSALPYQRTPGVCYQVSQLLRLRQAGFMVWLHHVHPVLKRSLDELQLTNLFTWAA